MTPSTLWKYAGCLALVAGAVTGVLFVSATVADAQIVSPSFDRPVEKTVQPVPVLVPAGAGFPAPVGAPLQMAPGVGQTREDLIVDNATAVIEQFVSMPLRKIPGKVFREAQAIAIIPNVIKGGFIVGIRHGMGVLLPKAPNGGFGPPRFVSLTGGSVGFQAGVQSTDVVLVFRTDQAVQNLLHGTFTLGADASAAAGPFGRQASAATTAQMNAGVWSYSKSRGAFVGASLDGSALQIDNYADQMYYHTATGFAGASWPPSAHRLVSVLDSYLGITPTTTPAVIQAAPVVALAAPAPSVPTQEAIRGQLAATAPHLYAALPDEKWRNFLALPQSVYYENKPIDSTTLQASLAHFDSVASSPQYHLLASEPVFQKVYGLLKRYTASTTASGLSLPPPPSPTTVPTAASVLTQPVR